MHAAESGPGGGFAGVSVGVQQLWQQAEPAPRPCVLCLTLSRGARGADAARRRGAGAFDTFLNVQITVVLAVQLVLCCACASASLHWRASQGFARYHLQLTDFSEGARPHARAGSILSTAWVTCHVSRVGLAHGLLRGRGPAHMHRQQPEHSLGFVSCK